MAGFLRLAALLAFVPFIVAAPAATDCTGTISSLDDVAAAVKCTTVNINSFTVPAGETFNLDLADGTTVNMRTSLPRTSRARAPSLVRTCASAMSQVPTWGCLALSVVGERCTAAVAVQ